MYPTSPTVTQWRAVAADRARANGVPVPSWYDGSAAADQRLRAEAADLTQKITVQMHRYVLDHPADFPPQFAASATAYLGSAAATADHSKVEYGVGEMVSDFAGAVGDEIVSINETVNPLSGTNRGKVFWIMAAGAAAYFVGPILIAAIGDAVRKAK